MAGPADRSVEAMGLVDAGDVEGELKTAGHHRPPRNFDEYLCLCVLATLP
jgi:hypothetical protein